ncbi:MULTISPECIES: hypothetical protein [Kitasatospora]|uniref:P-loop NTPase n=1 Tax=Kitasatospora TaxID=2063 RepID=UPI0011D2561D|nr:MULTISPECIES: hypothetical protein [Kitasatospora]
MNDIIESVLLESMEYGPDEEPPPVVPVPGSGDITSLSPNRMLANALTQWWGSSGLQDQDDIIDGLRKDVFADFETWAAAARSGLIGWHPGILPGEGSVLLEKSGMTFGLVVVNSVFRMVLPDPSPDLATCTAEQLSAAAGGDWNRWRHRNHLSMVLAGQAAPWPDAIDLGASDLLVAANEGQSTVSTAHPWLTVSRTPGRRHRLLRISGGGSESPALTDLAAARSEQRITITRPRPTASRVQTAAETYDEESLLASFYKQVATGQMVLVLVSGVEEERGLITVDELGQRLAKAVFGEVPVPPPAMSETWSAALAQMEPQVIEREISALYNDQKTTSPTAHRILGTPWSRIYDFTASDALSSVAALTPRPADSVTVINACHDKPGKKNSLVELVAMNGIASGTLTSVDFHHPDSDDTDARSLWLKRLKAEMLCHPVVFMASSPSSAALWQTVSLFGPPGGANAFPRFIVTPAGTSADRVRMNQNGLTHIRRSPAEFSIRRLMAGQQPLAEGKKRQAEVLQNVRRGTGISVLRSLLDRAPGGSSDFLKGSDPKWGDIVDGYAANLSIVEAIRAKSAPDSDGQLPIILVEGRAGSGKTAALMAYAYDLHKHGSAVGWIDREATIPLPEIRSQAKEMDLHAVFVDDVDIFGGQAARLLKELRNGGSTLVVAAIRTTRSEVIDATFRPRKVDADHPMTDGDLKSLIKVLKKNGLLGILKQYRFSPDGRLNKLREICQRSLLAAMIQVVTGKPFEEKVRGEFIQLTPEQRALYATVCVFESAIVFKKRGIEEADLLQIVSPHGPTPKMKIAIDRLLGMRLIDRAQDGMLRCRQRTIADTMVETVLKEDPKQLGSVIEFLLKFYAGYAGHLVDNDDPYRRIMIRLLNHSLMVSLRLPNNIVRDIYSSVHDLLQDDFHYWLQRGEFEFETGNIDLAANYLESARGSGGTGDYLVQTAWSAVTLRRSADSPRDSSLLQNALEAISTLEHVVRTRGNSSPHSFAVIARSGTEWLTACQNVLPANERIHIAGRILDVVKLGRRICQDNHQAMHAADAYEPRLQRIIKYNFGLPV